MDLNKVIVIVEGTSLPTGTHPVGWTYVEAQIKKVIIENLRAAEAAE